MPKRPQREPHINYRPSITPQTSMRVYLSEKVARFKPESLELPLRRLLLQIHREFFQVPSHIRHLKMRREGAHIASCKTQNRSRIFFLAYLSRDQPKNHQKPQRGRTHLQRAEIIGLTWPSLLLKPYISFAAKRFVAFSTLVLYLLLWRFTQLVSLLER